MEGRTLRIDIITIFPEYFAPIAVSLIGKAVQRGDIVASVHDLRTWTHDVHRTVDDTPFGGGPGMVMKPEPWGEALDAVVGPAPGDAESDAQLIVPTPAGALFTQAMAAELAQARHLVFACGRYEGIDDRVTQHASRQMRVRELSIGDYVLTNGAIAAVVLVDAIVRLLPGTLGHKQSAEDDSFSSGLLEAPHYTRPAEFRGWNVPDVLLSGNHAEIDAWRKAQALRRTRENRPDLLK